MRRALPVQAIGVGDVLFARSLDSLRQEPIIVDVLRVRNNPEDQINEFITWINRKLLAEYAVDEDIVYVEFQNVPIAVVEEAVQAFKRERWTIQGNLDSYLYFIA